MGWISFRAVRIHILPLVSWEVYSQVSCLFIFLASRYLLVAENFHIFTLWFCLDSSNKVDNSCKKSNPVCGPMPSARLASDTNFWLYLTQIWYIVQSDNKWCQKRDWIWGLRLSKIVCFGTITKVTTNLRYVRIYVSTLWIDSAWIFSFICQPGWSF